MNDQIAEIAPFCTPHTELPQLLMKMGEHIKPVPTKPAKVIRDADSNSYIFNAELPIVGGNIYDPKTTEIFARIITKQDEAEGSQRFLSFRTASSGRADYFFPFIFKVINGKSQIMSTIMIKGSGSQRALEKSASPFAERGAGEIEGAASITDIRLDARNSKTLVEAGIRARVALGVFALEEVEYQGKSYSQKELLDAGIVKQAEDLPGIGIFASRTALRIEDVERIIKEKQTSRVDALISYLIRTTGFDDAPEFQEFYQKHKEASRELGILSPDQRQRILTHYSLSLASVLGRQTAKFEKMGAIKVVKDAWGKDINKETVNNVTCLGESVDNSQLINGANMEQIVEFQKSILGLALSIPRDIEMDPDDAIEFQHNTVIKFIDAYLDEMVPEWRKPENILKEFLNLESQALWIDNIEDIRRAYWITHIKREKKMAENTGGSDIKYTHLADLTYDFLSHILENGHTYTKSKTFLEDYLRTFKGGIS